MTRTGRGAWIDVTSVCIGATMQMPPTPLMRREALVERVEAAVLRAAAILRTVARAERIGFRLRGDLRIGDESETESSGQGEKAHDILLLPAGAGCSMQVEAWLRGQRPSRFGRAVVA